MKTFNRQDVFSITNAKTDYKHIGECGYFSDHLDSNLDYWEYGKLRTIQDGDGADIDAVFGVVTNDPDQQESLIATASYGLFIPEDKVIEKEQKWRAFKDFEEFRKALNYIDFGKSIEYRDRNNNEYMAVFNGYLERNDKLEIISFGSWQYPVKTLFEYYEFYNEQTDKWQPFGIEE